MSVLKFTLFIFLISIFTIAPSQNRCASDFKYYSETVKKRASLSQHRALPADGLTVTTDTLYIPVVVHILYNTAEQNISDEQVKSQIDVLNEDYAAQNATAAEVPDAWKGLLQDSKMRFVLAARTPGVNPQNTNGITRKYVSASSFQYNDVSIKSAANGGVDPWPADDYLNIWVCNLSNGILGFATFPGGAPEEDGVVIHYKAFGRIGDLNSKYNLGRSGTHEVGHWFELIHVWGDEPNCDIDDLVEDTPLQGDANLCCPKYPKYDNCTSSGDGVMFTNYLDYSDDKFMEFFTPGQIARMDTAIMDYRSSLYLSDGETEFAMRSFDVSVEEIVNPVMKTEVRCFEPTVKIKNRGTSTVKNIHLVYNIYEGNTKSFTVTDSIVSGGELNVTLPLISGDNGLNILEVRISDTDSNTVNNYCSRSFYAEDDLTGGCTDGSPLVYPNPVSGSSFCVRSNFTKSQNITIRVVNVLGQAIYESEAGSNPGDSFLIPVDNSMQRGVYFIQLVGEDESSSTPFIYFPDGNNTESNCD